MSFSFGFSQADLLDEDITPSVTSAAPSTFQSTNVASLNPPKVHSLESILNTLKDVRITFDNYKTTNGNIVYRREIFDVKHQCMVEDENEDDNKEIRQILLGSEEELDLRKNVYEGGFKSWECSYDLVDEVAKNEDTFAKNSILELGCGSALPSCFIFQKWLEKNSSGKTLVLGDYNYEVLRLVTIPNLVVHWASTLSVKELASLQNPEIPMKNDEIQLTKDLADAFINTVKRLNIQLHFVSGSWGPEFVDIVSPMCPDLILSSETIYSLDTLPIFIQTLTDLMLKNQCAALIAAKSYYFGVGGSVKEFTSRLASCGFPLQIDTADVSNSSLKRSIITIVS
ncbi:hypothetical protein CJJ07_001799 [Candidozyma auris]|nr:hypothetical protein CJJ07_001799 [[Candida] auris]QEL61484.1 hypothetical protein CJJ09_003630 [[Candida] auris]